MHAIVAEKNVEEQTRHVLSEIFSGCSLDKVGVRLWDGTAWPDERPRAAMLALKHSGALGRMFLPGTEVGLAEAYLRFKRAGVPAELHIYSTGGHGFGLRPTNQKPVGAWVTRFDEWMADSGFVKR